MLSRIGGEVENPRMADEGSKRGVGGNRKEVVASVRGSGEREARTAVVVIRTAVRAHCSQASKGGEKKVHSQQSIFFFS